VRLGLCKGSDANSSRCGPLPPVGPAMRGSSADLRPKAERVSPRGSPEEAAEEETPSSEDIRSRSPWLLLESQEALLLPLGGRCLFCGLFIPVHEGNRVYGLVGPDCWNR